MLVIKMHSEIIVITPYEDIREGWEESFKIMADKRNDQLLDEDDLDHSIDLEEWKW